MNHVIVSTLNAPQVGVLSALVNRPDGRRMGLVRFFVAWAVYTVERSNEKCVTTN